MISNYRTYQNSMVSFQRNIGSKAALDIGLSGHQPLYITFIGYMEKSIDLKTKETINNYLDSLKKKYEGINNFHWNYNDICKYPLFAIPKKMDRMDILNILGTSAPQKSPNGDSFHEIEKKFPILGYVYVNKPNNGLILGLEKNMDYDERFFRKENITHLNSSLGGDLQTLNELLDIPYLKL